jgi:hypothetical protein
MSDEQRRRLERAGRASASPEDQARWLLERLRAGDLDLDRLALATHLGHAPAGAALDDADHPGLSEGRHRQQRGQDDFLAWLHGLTAWGQARTVEVAAAAARFTIQHVSLGDSTDETVLCAELWLRDRASAVESVRRLDPPGRRDIFAAGVIRALRDLLLEPPWPPGATSPALNDLAWALLDLLPQVTEAALRDAVRHEVVPRLLGLDPAAEVERLRLAARDSGRVTDAAAWLAARVGARSLRREELALAAFLGHPAALLALRPPDERVEAARRAAEPPDPGRALGNVEPDRFQRLGTDPLSEWLVRLEEWGRDRVLDAAFAGCVVLREAWAGTPWEQGLAEAYRLIEAWSQATGAARLAVETELRAGLAPLPAGPLGPEQVAPALRLVFATPWRGTTGDHPEPAALLLARALRAAAPRVGGAAALREGVRSVLLRLALSSQTDPTDEPPAT